MAGEIKSPGTQGVPAAWQDLFVAADGSGPRAMIKVRVIERAGQPFLILPAEAQLASRALALYSAQTFRAQLAKRLLGLTLNLRLPLAPPIFLMGVNGEEPFAAFLAQTAGSRGFPRFAILAGNPRADGRRFVILVFNEQGRPVAVVKAGIGEPAIRLIEQEATFLASVSQNTPGTPRLRSAFRSTRLHALALDFIPGRSPGPADESALEPLLASWIDSTRTIPVQELPAWQRLAGRPGFHPAAWEQLKNVLCRPVIYHGDFTPWNVKITGGEWRVLDWERGELSGIPGWDWFHYVIQSAVLVEREPVDRLAARVERLLASESFARYAARAKIAGRERWLVLAYLNYSIEILKQTEELQRVQSLWEMLAVKWRE